MFIYNVTTKVSWSINEIWLKSMKHEYMPAMLGTGCFSNYRLSKLHEQDDEEGPTYVVQYYTESKALYNKYLELYANEFRKEYAEKWGNSLVDFRTLLEVIEQK